MKSNLLNCSVMAGLLLLATASSWALPPRQHAVSGVIETLDWNSRRLTIKSADNAPGLVFVWNDRTRFTKHGGCLECSLAVGRTVSLYYRREAGQNVLRELGAQGAACQERQR